MTVPGLRQGLTYLNAIDTLHPVAKERTEQRARQLVDQIMRDARANDHKALLAIDADPETAVLLDLLPETATDDANAHLHWARAWRARQNKKAHGKLDAVQTALDGLDIFLAKVFFERSTRAFWVTRC